MTALRPISPFESGYFGRDTTLGAVPTGGMPLFIGTTVTGPLDIARVRGVLDGLAAAHPLLRCRTAEVDGVACLVRDDTYRPPLRVRTGGESAYLTLINAPQDWSEGLFRAEVLREGDRHQLVLVVHHGIADGRSAAALLALFWRNYTAGITGEAAALVFPDQSLPPAMDVALSTVIGAGDAEAWLDTVRVAAAGLDPAAAPRTLPHDGGAHDPLGRFALRRVELSAERTSGLVRAARDAGLTVHALLTGVALAALRTRFPEPGAVPMFCGHAADVRGELTPPVPLHALGNYASGAGTYAVAGDDADPFAIGRDAGAALRTALDAHEPARFILAVQRADAATAALLAAPPTVALSNLGRLPAHQLPAELAFVRDDIYAMGPGMPPKLTVFTRGPRLTVQLEFDTAVHARAGMDGLHRTLAELLDEAARVTHAA
ncbi:phthiocerol/phthiodiolone dimycocerosyl transferase family protein [Nocardia thailandica]